MHRIKWLFNDQWLTCTGIGLLLTLLYACHQGVPAETASAQDTLGYRMIKSDLGIRKNISLRGGSQVVLNSHSTLGIPNDSPAVSHHLTLDGDAFFNLSSPDSDITIETGMLTLNTSNAVFRVHAHRENAGQSVELLSGNLIAAKAYPSDYPEPDTLRDGEMIMINKDIDLMEKETFDTTALLIWKAGILNLDHISLPQALRTIGDWYDIDIQTNNSPRDTATVTARYDHAPLLEILDQLGKQEHFQYTVKGNTIMIHF